MIEEQYFTPFQGLPETSRFAERVFTMPSQGGCMDV
jgi:hypothetical protein